jgi:hypothetical protein
MALSPDDLLADAPVGAAVAALSERNRHHLEDMDAEEREQALEHWRELVMVVLTAARATLGDEPPEADAAETLGRAVIVLEDLGGDEVALHASFFPQLQDLGGGEVAATPAQATAIELLESFGEG